MYSEIIKMTKKFFIYSFLFLGLNLILRLDFTYLNLSFGEVSITEFTQSILLLLTSYSFFKIGHKNEKLKRASFLMGSFFIVLLIREQDHYLDNLILGSWFYPALIVSFSAIIYAFKKKKETVQGMTEIMKVKEFDILVLGMAMLLVFSRLYGMGDFWKEVMDENYIRIIKNISEEAIELLSYLIIAISGSKIKRRLI